MPRKPNTRQLDNLPEREALLTPENRQRIRKSVRFHLSRYGPATYKRMYEELYSKCLEEVHCRPRYEGQEFDAAIGPYVATIVRNAVISDAQRTRRNNERAPQTSLEAFLLRGNADEPDWDDAALAKEDHSLEWVELVESLRPVVSRWTPRKLRVFGLLLAGESLSETGRQCGVSHQTVQQYREAIKAQLLRVFYGEEEEEVRPRPRRTEAVA